MSIVSGGSKLLHGSDIVFYSMSLRHVCWPVIISLYFICCIMQYFICPVIDCWLIRPLGTFLLRALLWDLLVIKLDNELPWTHIKKLILHCCEAAAVNEVSTASWRAVYRHIKEFMFSQTSATCLWWDVCVRVKTINTARPRASVLSNWSWCTWEKRR